MFDTHYRYSDGVYSVSGSFWLLAGVCHRHVSWGWCVERKSAQQSCLKKVGGVECWAENVLEP